MKVPCKDCITFGICKHKKFLNLFRQCSILREYEPNYHRVDRRSHDKLQAIVDVLNPTVWYTMPPINPDDETAFVYINSAYNSGYLGVE